jgi:hypothetical protein
MRTSDSRPIRLWIRKLDCTADHATEAALGERGRRLPSSSCAWGERAAAFMVPKRMGWEAIDFSEAKAAQG